MLALLSPQGRDYLRRAQPLLRFLDRMGGFEVDVVTDPSRLADPGRHRVVFAATDAGPLGAEEEEALAGWVRAGGGLVAAHGTLKAWSANRAIHDLAGFAPGEVTPKAELRVRVAGEHPITARLDPELLLLDEVHLDGARLPDDATPLLTVPWRYQEQVAAFARPAGDGRFVYVGLGGSEEAYASPAFLQLLHRTIRHAAGEGGARTFGVGLAGYGAIARDHGLQIGQVAGLELRTVADVSPARRKQAEADFGIGTHAGTEALLADSSVDLVVVGTPPSTHADLVVAALEAGKHVVAEKPFALRLADVDRMVEAAARRGRTLTCYQSRRWDPDFQALRKTVASGSVGTPFHLESFIGGYGHPCSYWHSHEPISGGILFDWGSHYLDWTLQLFTQPVASVSAVAQKLAWQDVTNADQVNVDVRFEGGAQATFLHSDLAAALKPKWYLLATGGAIVGDWRFETVVSRGTMNELVEEKLAPADSPARLTVLRPNGEGGVNREELALPARVANGFYRNLADHLVEGEPLAVPAAEARRNIAVMEAASISIAEGGRQVEVNG